MRNGTRKRERDSFSNTSEQEAPKPIRMHIPPAKRPTPYSTGELPIFLPRASIFEQSSKLKPLSIVEEKSSDQPIVNEQSIAPLSSANHHKITKSAPTKFAPHPPIGNPPNQIKAELKPEAAKASSDENFKVDLQWIKAPPGSPPAIKAPPGRKLPTLAKGIKQNPKTTAKPIEVHPLKKENETLLT